MAWCRQANVDPDPYRHMASLIMIHFFMHYFMFIDLRTAQVYWDAIFLVSQEVYLNFHHFCG